MIGQIRVHQLGAARALLVDRNPHRAAGRHHHARFLRHVPVRVDLVDFAKVQQVVVEVEPLAHAPAPTVCVKWSTCCSPVPSQWRSACAVAMSIGRKSMSKIEMSPTPR
jgi:hypothetical protein